MFLKKIFFVSDPGKIFYDQWVPIVGLRKGYIQNFALFIFRQRHFFEKIKKTKIFKNEDSSDWFSPSERGGFHDSESGFGIALAKFLSVPGPREVLRS